MSCRRDDITGEDRAQIALQCLAAGDRRDGTRQALVAQYKLSRQSIHNITVQARAALAEALKPKPHGPVAAVRQVSVTREHVLRSVVVLMDSAVTERKIQSCLAQILGYKASLGWISGQLSLLGERAKQVNADWQPAIDEPQAADEIFCQGVPTLLVVGSESLYIYHLTQQDRRDLETWACVLWDTPPTGQLARDGGKGLCAGASLAGKPGQLDWWHVLREVWHIDASLERAAYGALERLFERTASFDRAHTTKRLEQHLACWEKQNQQADDAIAAYDRYHRLACGVNDLFAMIDLESGMIVEEAKVIADLQKLGQQIRALGGRACCAVATTLIEQASWLFAYLPRLSSALAPLQAQWGCEAIASLCRLWQVQETNRRCPRSIVERQRLNALWQANFDIVAQLLGDDLFAAWDDVETVLGANWRTSSAAECVNSLLRTHFNAHKSTNQNALELRRFFHNTHTFARGKRAGHSPAELVGISLPPDPLTLIGLPALRANVKLTL